MILVVCLGAMAVAGYISWDRSHPVQAAIRGLRSQDRIQRETAVRDIAELSANDSGETIHALIPLIEDSDAAVRATVAEALGVVGVYAVRSASDGEAARAAVASLNQALKDPEAAVRGAAARALGTIVAGLPGKSSRARGSHKKAAADETTASPPAIDPKSVIETLLGALGDPDATVREAVLAGLRDSAPQVLSEPPAPLLAAVNDQSASNRAMAVSTLVNFPRGLDPLIPFLIAHVQNDEPPVQDACGKALGRIRPTALTSSALPAVIAGLGSSDREVRMHLISLLSRMSPDAHTAVPALIKVLREPAASDLTTMAMGRGMSVNYVGPAQEAADALGRIAPSTPAAGEAIAALVDVVRGGPQPRRAAAAEALGQFGKAAVPAVPHLIAMLKEVAASDRPSSDGDSVATALGQIAPGTPAAPAAVSALTDALKSPSIATRGGVLGALASFGPAAAGAAADLRSIKEKDPNPTMRESAAKTLQAVEKPAK